MVSRYKYEPTSAIRKISITVTHPHKWREKVSPWVVDNQSGARFQLTPDEETLIRQLSAVGAKGRPAQDVTAAFDHVAGAIVQRRLGYGFEWTRLAGLSDSARDTWLREHAEKR